MGITFERETLYAEISTSPISALAKKYEMSDVGLRKVCVALDIPLPGRGHWAKIAAGKPSPMPPLRATKGRTAYHCNPVEALLTPALAPAEWLDVRVRAHQCGYCSRPIARRRRLKNDRHIPD